MFIYSTLKCVCKISNTFELINLKVIVINNSFSKVFFTIRALTLTQGAQI